MNGKGGTKGGRKSERHRYVVSHAWTNAWMKDRVEYVYIYIYVGDVTEEEGVTIGGKKWEVGIGGRSN